MKMKKNILALILIVLMCVNGVSWANSPKTNDDNHADMIIEKMSKDISLTDNQKIIIKNRLKTLFGKIEGTRNTQVNIQQIEKKKQYEYDFQQFMDSILTDSQKNQLHLQMEKRQTVK